jgi:hypothetical protein
MVDDQYMLKRIETASDIVVGIMSLVFIAPADYPRVDDAKAAVLLYFKFGTGTLTQIEQDIKEMREFSDKGSLAISQCMARIGKRHGLLTS